jgi:hypothetical protein
MRRCCLLLIVTMGATVLGSCGRVFFYSNIAGAESCNSKPIVAHEWPSPDGKTKAVENRFDCPGWYSLRIDIIGSDGRTKTTAFSDRPSKQSRPNVWPDLQLGWKSDRELWITYPAGQDTTCISTAAELQVHCIDGTVSR